MVLGRSLPRISISAALGLGMRREWRLYTEYNYVIITTANIRPQVCDT